MLMQRRMPDKRRHRGAHPEDAALFAPSAHAALRAAVADYSWLLGRDYARPSALKLVGDRYHLTDRQRTAVMRCACSDGALHSRLARQVDAAFVAGSELWIDGYNVLTTIETALAGGVVIIGRDTCYRDMASIHGTFRKVNETVPALQLVGQTLARLQVARCVWLLDQPVSNSGRLAGIMRQIALANSWCWAVRIESNPDMLLARCRKITASADSIVLDRCGWWLSLARTVVRAGVGGAELGAPHALGAF